jgi:DnaJ-class molecular chaperone
MQTYYRILGVNEHAPPEEIKRAYRRLARRYHPDLAGCSASGSFREVREAYETLCDENRRRDYDARLSAARNARRPAVSARQTTFWTRDWLADEVAIDFPSMAEAIERIRRTFVGPEPASGPLSAEILVSPEEANEGVEVPLDVPVSGPCPDCGGRGESWSGHCVPCRGSGEASLRYRVHVSLPRGVADGTRFRFALGEDFAARTWVEVRVAVQRQESGSRMQR